MPWWREAVVYQIYPRSFADASGDGVGDLEGIRPDGGRQTVDHGPQERSRPPAQAEPCGCDGRCREGFRGAGRRHRLAPGVDHRLDRIARHLDVPPRGAVETTEPAVDVPAREQEPGELPLDADDADWRAAPRIRRADVEDDSHRRLAAPPASLSEQPPPAPVTTACGPARRSGSPRRR